MSALQRTRQLTALTHRFRDDRDGMAAIEFAFVGPLLITMLLGTVGVTQSIWANGRVSQAATSISDVISQMEELDDASFGDLMKIAPLMLEPFPEDELTVEVTSAIACNAGTDSRPDMKYFVIWSKSYADGQIGAGPQPTNAALSDPPSELELSDGGTLILTKVNNTFKPPISYKAGLSLDMEESGLHQPRSGEAVAYPDATTTTPQTCAELLG